MAGLQDAVDTLAGETTLSGVVRVDVDGEVKVAGAYGLAHRGHGVANTVDTRFGIASGVKGMTAAVVVSLIADGLLDLTTTARSVLGGDLPLIADDVTVEHLLAHRSGIGDYFDEDEPGEMTDYVLTVAAHQLAATEDYLRVLDGHATKFPAGQRFSYCNSGYVVLALVAERVSGTAFTELVQQRVCEPAGMSSTAFLRSDELPGDAAVGYLGAEGLRTNVFHLPVRGSGDGGIYCTVADVHAFWDALLEGRIVPLQWVDRMTTPVSEMPEQRRRYGLGFWLHAERDALVLEGADAGVSFRSVHDPGRSTTHTVVSNTTDGAWPVARYLEAT